MKGAKDVSDKFILELKELVLKKLEKSNIKVYLFGSRARGDASKYSDVDLGLISKDKIDNKTLSELKEIIEESHIPYQVDVVDLSNVSKIFKEKVFNEGIIWRD